MTHFTSFTFGGMNFRTFDHAGSPGFIAIDACRALGYRLGHTGAAPMVAHLEADQTFRIGRGFGLSPHTVALTESGLYALALRSRLPAARAFAKWVTGTVLPTLRRGEAVSAPEVVAKVPAVAPEVVAKAAPSSDTVVLRAAITALHSRALEAMRAANALSALLDGSR